MQLLAYRSWQGIAMIVAVLLLSTYWLGETVRVALVETWISSNQIRNLERAMKLDSDNPEIYYRMGTFYFLGAEGSTSNPVPWFRKSTELNPKIGKYWLGLGRACFVTRDQECANRALERALTLSPMTPSTLWEVATYNAFTGRLDLSFTEFKRLVEQDPEKADDLFHFTWLAFDPEVTWQRIFADIPDNRLKCRYVAFLTHYGRFDMALNDWTQIVSAATPPSFDEAKPYLQELLEAQRFGEGSRVWSDLLRRKSLIRPEGDADDNLVFNSSFERPPLNAGFDWNIVPANFVSTELSDDSAQSGKHALQVEYTVPHNTEGEAAYELVPVDPNQKYVLTAYSRSDEIMSDTGPQLRIQDAQCSACLDVLSEITRGTTPWHQLNVEFTTGPQTEIIRLSVWRSRSRTFPMDITGTFWLDSVSLKLTSSGANTDKDQPTHAASGRL